MDIQVVEKIENFVCGTDIGCFVGVGVGVHTPPTTIMTALLSGINSVTWEPSSQQVAR